MHAARWCGVAIWPAGALTRSKEAARQRRQTAASCCSSWPITTPAAAAQTRVVKLDASGRVQWDFVGRGTAGQIHPLPTRCSRRRAAACALSGHIYNRQPPRAASLERRARCQGKLLRDEVGEIPSSQAARRSGKPVCFITTRCELAPAVTVQAAVIGAGAAGHGTCLRRDLASPKTRTAALLAVTPASWA